MIRDLFDRRAATRACDQTWMSVAFLAVPATVTSVLAVSDQFTRWLSFMPGMTIVVHAALPVLALAATIAIITSVRNAPPPRGFGTQGPTPQYRFCTATRATAKVALLPLLIIAITSFWTATPNRLRGEKSAAGYVCTAAGTALQNAYVHVADRYARPISVVAPADDRGFFFVEIDPWRTRPVELRVAAPGCNGHDYTIPSTTRGQSCPKEQIESPQGGESFVWITECQ